MEGLGQLGSRLPGDGQIVACGIKPRPFHPTHPSPLTHYNVSLWSLQVHRKIREDSDMAQDSLQCLAQLASMHGPVFPDESAQVSYLAHLVEGLLSMINGLVQQLEAVWNDTSTSLNILANILY